MKKLPPPVYLNYPDAIMELRYKNSRVRIEARRMWDRMPHFTYFVNGHEYSDYDHGLFPDGRTRCRYHDLLGLWALELWETNGEYPLDWPTRAITMGMDAAVAKYSAWLTELVAKSRTNPQLEALRAQAAKAKEAQA